MPRWCRSCLESRFQRSPLSADRAALIACAFFAFASVANAQSLNYGFGGGAAFPINTYDVDVGYSVIGFIGFDAPGPLGARFEGGFNQFRRPTGGAVDAWSGSGNVVVTIPAKPVHPYVLAGLGYYTGLYVGSGGKFGTNTGVGVRVPVAAKVQLFSELRLHRTFEGHGLNQNYYVQLLFGVRL
jgi:hypothetical protein